MDAETETPRHSNGCSDCRFLGYSLISPDFDLYWCEVSNGRLGSPIAINGEGRFFGTIAAVGSEPVITETFLRALVEGLVDDAMARGFLDKISRYESAEAAL